MIDNREHNELWVDVDRVVHKPLGSTCKKVPLLSICNFCGNIWICDISIVCPYCELADIYIVPIPTWDDPKFNLKWLSKWLSKHGFDLIERKVEVVC